MSEVKALADSGVLTVPGENELTLVGYTTEGTEFTGAQTITVINVEPEGAGEVGKEKEMKKIMMTVVIFLSFTAFALAGGDQNHGSKGQGSTGSDGAGQTTQQRGK